MIPLKVSNESSPGQVTSEELVKMQREDHALQSVRNTTNVKGKSKVHRANLLKKYFKRDDRDNEKMTKTCKMIFTGGMVILDATCAAIIKPSKTSQEDMVEDEEMLELRGCQYEKTLADLRNWCQLNKSSKQGVT